MKKVIFLVLLSLVFPVFALEKNNCVVMGSSVELGLRQALAKEVDLDQKDLDLKKSRLDLIENVLVTEVFAKQLAREDVIEMKLIDYMSMYNAYITNNTRNLIVKYTYVNKQGKKNVYIGSALVDDDECSMGFKGYLTVSREF